MKIQKKKIENKKTAMGKFIHNPYLTIDSLIFLTIYGYKTKMGDSIAILYKYNFLTKVGNYIKLKEMCEFSMKERGTKLEIVDNKTWF